MNTKTNRRPISRLMAVLMALAMVVSVVFMQVSAEKANFAAPEKSMSIDYKQITVAAHSQGYITPEVLGLTNTTSRSMELPANEDGSVGMTLENAQKMAVLGVFGSDINENPNPYLYNYFYNTYAAANNLTPAAFEFYTLSKDVGGGPNGAAASGGYSKYGITVPASLYLEPEILIGIAQIQTDSSGNIVKTGYTDALAAYNEAKKATLGDSAATYDPKEVQYEMTHVYSFLQTLYDLSNIVDEIKEDDPSRTTRYGDPQIITRDIEKYVKGLEAYVVKKLKEDNAKPLTVAVIDTGYTDTLQAAGTIKKGQYVANTKDVSTQATTSFSRVGEFVADTATNIVDAIGNLPKQTGEATNSFANEYYVVTADQIAQYADVVLFCDVLSSIPENTGTSKVDSFKQDVATNCSSASLRAKVSDIEMMSSAFDCVGSIGANSVENLLGMAYYTAYMYPQYLNQFDVAAYWYENFYHVSDLNKLKSVMASNFATSSVQDAYAKDYSAANLNYDKDAVEAKIIEGMRYYEDNKSEFKDKLLNQNGATGENTGWVIDWDNGIGAGQREEPKDDPAPVTPDEPAVVLDGLAKGADGVWAMYDNGSVDTGYTGLAKSNYNGKWYIVKNGYLDWKYTGFGQNLTTKKWYRVVDGRVDFDAQSIYKKPENGKWYKTTNGRVTWDESSIYKNANGWYKCTNSVVTFKENGVFKNKNGWWYVKNSKVDFSYNGLASNKNGTWKIKNGKVDFGYSGKYQGKTIKNGKVV